MGNTGVADPGYRMTPATSVNCGGSSTVAGDSKGVRQHPGPVVEKGHFVVGGTPFFICPMPARRRGELNFRERGSFGILPPHKK